MDTLRLKEPFNRIDRDQLPLWLRRYTAGIVSLGSCYGAYDLPTGSEDDTAAHYLVICTIAPGFDEAFLGHVPDVWISLN